MLAKEVRDFYKLEVRVKTNSVILENIKVKFNKIVLSDGESAISISDRRLVYEVNKTIDGFRVNLYILNDVEDTSKRIDYLIDDDYEIEKLDIVIYSVTTNKKYDFTINESIGEQISKKVDIEVSKEMQECLSYISSGIENEELVSHIYEKISKDKSDIVSRINSIASIKTI